MRKPNLFIVGAPKSGTTSLFHALAQHGAVFACKKKEPLFFGSDFSKNRSYTEEEYLELFAAAKEETYLLEATTWYLFSERAAREIFEFNPESKIIIMLRNPVDLLYSLYYQRLFNGDEDLLTFEAALAAEPFRRMGYRIPSKSKIPREKYYYSEVPLFARQVQRYRKLFGPGQVHIIFYEDFRQNTEGVFDGVLAFLGLTKRGERICFRHLNRSKVNRSQFLKHFINHPPAFVSNFLRLLFPSAPARARIYRSLIKLNARSAERPDLTAETEQKLRRQFAPEIMELERLVDRDLSSWYD